jgi:hypothetical protein
MNVFKNTVWMILASALGGLAATRMPEFSWDTVPRYMHVRKATAFTSEEIRYLATFPLITFEKTTGSKEFGSTEAGTLQAAKAVKRIHSAAKILYYRNILVHYGSYEADQELATIPDAFLVNSSGDDRLVRGKVKAYDLSNKKVQDWWVSSAKQVCSSPSIDGLFIDGNIKALEHGYLLRDVGEQKKVAVEEAYHKMMKRLPMVLGSKKLILANILRARFDDAGLEYIQYFDGSYIEGFTHAVGRTSRVEYVAKGIAAVQSAARRGKIIAFTMGMGEYADTDMDDDTDPSPVKNMASVQDRFLYGLGVFLICAEEYSYFMASDGYGVDNGRSGLWMKEIPEYSRPLGAPKGRASKSGNIYRRDFAHASVTVDIENEKADIVWESETK